MKRRRTRHQVVIQLMPGSEPWFRVEMSGGHFKTPGQISLIELWELLSAGTSAPRKLDGQLLVRVPLRDLKPF